MRVSELRRGGTRGSGYVYVLIGNELVHVSEVGKLVKHDGDEYVYEIPSNIPSWIFIFHFSRSGYGSVTRCPLGNYVNTVDYTKCESKAIEDAVNDWLSDVNFRIKNPKLRGLLNELFSEFVIMANEARSYWGLIGGELRFMGHASRLSEFFNNPRIYYFTELSIPSDTGRIRGIKTTMSLIYENWIAAKVAEALGTRSLIRRSWEANEPFINMPVTVWFEQGGETSFAILNTPHGDFTMWLEFQVNPAIHVFPNLKSIMANNKIVIPTKHGRRAVRPDVVIARGKFNGINDLIKSGGGIDFLIECKALPYEDWESDVDEQVIPYVKQFRPRKTMLIVRYAVPNNVKEKLSNNGVEVIEDVRPGGKGVSKLVNAINSAIT